MGNPRGRRRRPAGRPGRGVPAGRARFRGDAAVTTWLHRVVVNACLDRLRAAKVRRAEALPDDLEEHGGRGSALTLPATDDDRRPGRRRRATEQRALVLDALATLPAEQRAALVLVDMEGYPVAEAAAILDCAVGTVKSRCSRGRARLAELLRRSLGDRGVTRRTGDPNPARRPVEPTRRPARVPPPLPTAPHRATHDPRR